jgi:hypothetical protein
MAAIADLVTWFRESHGNVAIYDGTNSTHERRQLILNRIKQERPDLRIKTVFIEVICNDQQSMSQWRTCHLSCAATRY